MSSEKITAIIIDDEESSRDVLQYLLSKYDDIEIAGIAENAKQGVEKILENLPDVIFLDVEMPGISGLEMLNDLKMNGFMPHIIFTTGQHKYSIPALRENAHDYLIKPIDIDELHQSLIKLRIELKRNNTNSTHSRTSTSQISKLKFHTRTGLILIDPNEIVYCEADGNYTKIFLSEKESELITLQIGHVEAMLANSSLIRVGKSFIINKSYVKKTDRKTETCTFEKNKVSFNLSLSANCIKMLEKEL